MNVIMFLGRNTEKIYEDAKKHYKIGKVYLITRNNEQLSIPHIENMLVTELRMLKRVDFPEKINIIGNGGTTTQLIETLRHLWETKRTIERIIDLQPDGLTEYDFAFVQGV